MNSRCHYAYLLEVNYLNKLNNMNQYTYYTNISCSNFPIWRPLDHLFTAKTNRHLFTVYDETTDVTYPKSHNKNPMIRNDDARKLEFLYTIHYINFPKSVVAWAHAAPAHQVRSSAHIRMLFFYWPIPTRHKLIRNSWTNY